MRGVKEAGKDLLATAGQYPGKCGVRGCEHESVEYVKLLRFDPIDHDPIGVQVCENHLEWAEERNKLAERIHERLRDWRKEVGEEFYAEVAELAHPTMGALPDDIMQGEVDKVTDSDGWTA